MQAHHDADRSLRARALLDDGTGGLLAGLGPRIRWRRPTLEVDYPLDRDLHLRGRAAASPLSPPTSVGAPPWHWPTPTSRPSSSTPLRHQDPDDGHTRAPASPAPLCVLIGATRAFILQASATRHTTVLRNSGPLVSHLHGPSVLHVLEAPGTTDLRPSGGASEADLDLALSQENRVADVVRHAERERTAIPGFQVLPEDFDWFSIVLARTEAATLTAFAGGGKPTPST